VIYVKLVISVRDGSSDYRGWAGQVVSAANRAPSRNKGSVDFPLLSARTSLLTGRAALPDVNEDEGGTRRRSWLEALRYKPEGRGFDS
jgi:hypothetical protein